MNQGTRVELVRRLVGVIGDVTTAHPLRVAIDGPPAAGRTMLGDELAVVLRADVIRASIGDFLLPVHSAIGAASARPKAAISTLMTTPRCAGSCSIR